MSKPKVITDEAQIKKVAEIEQTDSNTFPTELILYQNKLIIISEKLKSTSYTNQYIILSP